MVDRILNSDLGLIFTEFHENRDDKLLEPNPKERTRLQTVEESPI